MFYTLQEVNTARGALDGVRSVDHAESYLWCGHSHADVYVISVHNLLGGLVDDWGEGEEKTPDTVEEREEQ